VSKETYTSVITLALCAKRATKIKVKDEKETGKKKETEKET
jgi:hypothetical protein